MTAKELMAPRFCGHPMACAVGPEKGHKTCSACERENRLLADLKERMIKAAETELEEVPTEFDEAHEYGNRLIGAIMAVETKTQEAKRQEHGR